MKVLILQVPDARKASLKTLLAEDRPDALRARIVVAVDGRRSKILKDAIGDPKVLHTTYRVSGRLATDVTDPAA